MRTWRTTTTLLAVAALTLAATACGDDDDSDSATNNDSGDNGSGGGSGELSLDEPITIAGAVEIAGESDAAVNSFDYGFRLAIKQINEAGGIGGQQIEYERVPLSVSDGSRATSQ
ncbi:MAG TPA: hypothetical protein VIL36_24640, partial [Acidimicrobiales bacterium]